ncbi:Putative peptidase, metal-dependent hydrolase [Desulfamplus magnetovallimortis]|uniref:Putative peptidase, metal-dependent hydrolase n=1 Tax=Desulfamplus magnetovallimortis TaxID=1246637 RepID=A0A1W1H4J9_9BACT|nr:site-2 protease family protein [Desulfamplus magnetovallimortis]SLM27401.1 Putative peptidase, metal-dependent hydrolase [Desulfamplus magnetovallimortis]
MTSEPLIDIPFLLNYTHLEFDKAVIFAVSALMAITVNAEAQAFMATLLGDADSEAKDRFHFNPFMHVNLAGLLCFAAAGFGWPGQIKVNTDHLEHPAISLMVIKFAGAFANLILAGIAGSILWVMSKWNLQDQVFTIVVSVNIMVFVFHFIPLPPLAGSSIFYGLIPETLKKSNFSKYFMKIFPYVFVALIILMKLQNWDFPEKYFYPVVQTIFNFISGN